MNSVLFGLVSATSLGTADFMARFSSRALGAVLNYAVVLLVGAIGASLWLILSGQPLVWSPRGWALAVAHGFSVAAMCILLYAGLARGPVAIVAPIVATHPAFVLIVNVAMGVRPSLVQWFAMLVIVLGGVLIARNAKAHPQFASGPSGDMRKTIVIASAASLAYVALILTGQAAAQLIGELQTLWIGRCSGLLFAAVVLLIQRQSPLAVPVSWLPFVIAQGMLDGAGYAAFLAGLNTVTPYIAVVVASTFSVVTVLLAKFILKEPINQLQAMAIFLIASGTAVLAGTSG